MKFDLLQQLKATKKASKEIALLSSGKKEQLLYDLAKELMQNKQSVMKANKEDVRLAKENGKSAAFIDRLTLSEKTLSTMVEQVKDIAKQNDYIGEVIEEKSIANGVMLKKIRVALGVVGIIYESRPNVTIDVAALCIKSGNAVVLRGGSDAFRTNSILVGIIHHVLKQHHMSTSVVGFVEDTNRKLVTLMLQQHKLIDVIIPRGGYDLVKKVVEESKIAVLYHASGGARIYVDKSADIHLAGKVCVNAKINRPATCNSVDTILVHKDIAKKFLEVFMKELAGRAEIRGDEESYTILQTLQLSQEEKGNAQTAIIKKAKQEDYSTEFLDYIISIKVVTSEIEALQHIEKYTNHHSEAIIASDEKVIQTFVDEIDAAALFVNCSTRLHDGGIFELGAEMGIATGKLHVRGPVGAKEMTTYKWVAYGKGQVRE